MPTAGLSLLRPYRQESIGRGRRAVSSSSSPIADRDRVLSRDQAASDRRRLAAVEPGQEGLAGLRNAQQRVPG